jgi:hypothetical protein
MFQTLNVWNCTFLWNTGIEKQNNFHGTLQVAYFEVVTTNLSTIRWTRNGRTCSPLSTLFPNLLNSLLLNALLVTLRFKKGADKFNTGHFCSTVTTTLHRTEIKMFQLLLNLSIATVHDNKYRTHQGILRTLKMFSLWCVLNETQKKLFTLLMNYIEWNTPQEANSF